MDDRLLLYDCAAAPSARRARMFIAEKGRSIARMNIDLRARAHLAPEYLAINPAGMVPALRTVEGEIITENDGIAAYLEALWPDPGPTPFLAGAEFSYADITGIVFADFAVSTKLIDLSASAAIHEWGERVRARRSYRESV